MSTNWAKSCLQILRIGVPHQITASRLKGVVPVLAIMLCGSQFVRAVESEAAIQSIPGPREPVAREIVGVGMASYGNYRLFGAARNCKLYTSGVEYDRPIFRRFLKAQVDYSSEVLPLVLLNEPTQADIWGNPKSKDQQFVEGIGILPIGFRLMWRGNTVVKPYLVAKGGVLGFDKKVLSSKATYLNFTAEESGGVQIRLNQRIDLRLGLFGEMHFSNANIVSSNPGLDVMNASFGLSFHTDGRSRSR